MYIYDATTKTCKESKKIKNKFIRKVNSFIIDIKLKFWFIVLIRKEERKQKNKI